MTPEILTAVGWCAAALIGGVHLRARRRLVLVARASHELRGPLCAARLGLGTLAGEPGRVAAIDLELARAGRALEDLTAAPSGARARELPEPVDVAALAHRYAPAWTTLATAHGAGFRLEAGDPPDGLAGDLHVAPSGGGAAGDPRAPLPRGDGRRFDWPAPARRGFRGGSPPEHARHLRAVPAGELPRTWGADAAPALPRTWRADGPPAPAPPRPATVVSADPLRIAQAVANLVANAAEHGGGVVRVRVCGTGERVRIEVADDGPGLPAAVGELARARTGRRGHGLAIAAAIAEQSGGRLSALPARAGARLALDLPAAG